MKKIASILHLVGIRNIIAMFLVNKVFKGTSPRSFKIKRKLLIWRGYTIGQGTKVVGPIECTGQLTVGDNCWIGKNFRINGNGSVTIADNCDIAPEVTFQTGGHLIGSPDRRAGEGVVFTQTVGSGTWIGGRATILNNTNIGKSCVIAGCACVTKDVPDNTVVGGVPAKVIRSLDND